MVVERTPDRRNKAAGHVKSRQLYQKNRTATAWPPKMLQAPGRVRRSLSTLSTGGTFTPVQKKKKSHRRGRQVLVNKEKLEMVNQELNAQFDRLMLMKSTGSAASLATNEDDIIIEELSYKTSQINIAAMD